MLSRQARRAAQSGMSLVELMVGVAVGLFVVAAASTMAVTQLGDNRRLLLELQVQQDLRATADIITRELRRAGSFGFLRDSAAFVWSPGATSGPNFLLAVTPAANGLPATAVSYQSSRTMGQNGPYGFRLNNGQIDMQLGPAGWQVLTDINAIRITTFNITAQNQPAVTQVACTKLCASGIPNDRTCWPSVAVRSFRIDITGQSVADPAVVRTVSSIVRLRADQILFNDPVNPSAACPS